ncbi:alpha/beta fold hydrolase, partial [Acinetobacter baumannii]|uniref:alpha/beta fold hydrolase n=1 Tax=Acinetobacter baumannii TaxID=470 RepID=UPI002FE268AA
GERVGLEYFDDYVADLDIFLFRVIAQSHVPVFVFGHSMGGAIVTLDAIEHRPNVAGIILSGAALEPGVSGFKIGATNLTDAFAPSFDVFNVDLDKFSRDPAVVKAAREDPLVYQGAATAHMAYELIGGIQRIDARMGDVKAPLF